jgi:hypothetical protein
MTNLVPKPDFIPGYRPNARLTPDNFLDGPTVTAIFPKTVKLQLDEGEGTVTFHPGTQEVPEELMRPRMHWWLKAQGVREYGKTKVNKTLDPADPTARGVHKITVDEFKYMQSSGCPVGSVEAAQQFFEGLEPAAREALLEKAKGFQAPKPLPPQLKDEDFERLTKAQLVEWATKTYKVDLDPGLTKAALVEFIEELQTAPGK